MNKLGFAKNSKKPSIKSLNDLLSFGQYKDETVEYVLKNDPSYILWLDNEEICDVDDEILEMAQDTEMSYYVDKRIDWGLDYGED